MQIFHRQVELGRIVMALRQGVIVNILRRNYPVFRINRCCAVGNTAQFALPFKRYATTLDYGQSLGVKTTEFRSGLHGEILEERHQLARLAILVPSSIGRPRRQGFVGRQISRNDIGLPIALLRTIIARRCQDALQKDIVILLVTNLLICRIFSVDVNLLRGKHHPCCRSAIQITRNGCINVFFRMRIKDRRCGLQWPSAVVVPRIITNDALNVHKYLGTAYTRCLYEIGIIQGIQFDIECRGRNPVIFWCCLCCHLFVFSNSEITTNNFFHTDIVGNTHGPKEPENSLRP